MNTVLTNQITEISNSYISNIIFQVSSIIILLLVIAVIVVLVKKLNRDKNYSKLYKSKIFRDDV